MFCKNTGKKAILLVLALLLIAVLAGQASAYTAPYKLIVFTDKQVYLDYAYNFDTLARDTTNKDNTRGSFNQKVNVFALLLDSDGNIVKGLAGSNFSSALRDVERWNHSGQESFPFYQVIPTNGAYYPSSMFPAFTDADGDGIYNSILDVTDLNQLASPPPVTDHINISINVTVSYMGTNYRTNVSVLFGVAGCHHPESKAITSAHAKTNHNGVVCTACHWGYQYALGVHGANNSVMYNDAARYMDPDTTVTTGYDYKLGYVKSGGNATTWDNSNASFCVMCHGGPINANILDLGAGSAPASTDQNGDTLNDGNRPSCSWYQGPAGNGSNYPGCHAPQTGFNGSTKIALAQLLNVDWTGWSAGPAKSKVHNHSNPPKTNGIPCELCHAGSGAPGTGTGGMHMVAGLPNRTSDYSNINDQCQICHNVTDGWLNITANGGSARNHSKTNQCSRCHVYNNKLDSHVVPTGAYGGKWCLNCHNLTGTAPIDLKLDPSITNISNIDYTHHSLNYNSDAQNSSRICWGCHTNNSVIKNGRVNSTSLPDGEHAQGYDTPRSCTMCHNNSNSTLNFGAPQTYRHTWYASDMNTPAVTYCVNCHATDEMLNSWDESVFPPRNGNESASHYGKNRTSTFPPVGSREYCGYCHQNESTVMGPFAKPDNEIRSDHASQNTTPGCGNTNCHKPGRMHEDTLTVPNFNESNIASTCLACHSPADYSFHNSTVTCWDCHMGNVSSINPTWIHPIQFIQYNGNFTGAKLTSATCYDCHKSSRVDNVTRYLSGRNPPKIFNQAHSNDPGNGTKWGDYWKYTPTTYNFARYYVTSGIINPAFPFDNIRVPSNDYMELKETKNGSNNGGSFPYTRAEQEINGPPVPNWTYSSRITAGTSTITASQDGYSGAPPGSLKTVLKTTSASGSGIVSWNYSFYYKPNSTEFAYANASMDYFINVSTARTQTIYFRLIKPSGAVVALASASCCAFIGNSGWVTLRNDSFSSELNEDGSSVPYKIQLYAELSAAKPNTNTYMVNFDNIRLKFHEKVWNMYEIIINTTGVPTTGSSRLGMSYQMHMESSTLMIYNRTLGDYEYLDTMDKGVFFDYVKDINTTHHVDPTGDGTTGNVSVKFADNDRSDVDEISDLMHIRYLYVFSDQGLQYPCEQCHSPNKHYVNPTIGSPERFRAGNSYNSSDLKNSTWCQQCHWQGAANYSKMIQEFNVTRNPPENIPPEITGNKTYGKFNTSRDGKTAYVNHTGSAYSEMNDSGCFKCHGKAGDLTTSQFIHNIQVGQSGNRRCTTCHNTSALNTNYKKVDVEAVRRGMHGNLKNASANVSNTSDPIELACWSCHGDGVYKDPDQHRNANAWSCDRCHTSATAGKLGYNAPAVYEHIPPNLATPEADVMTTFNATSWACADCHNNSINATALINDNEYAPNTAIAGHYGVNRTAGMLMYDYSNPPKGNSENCIYCHKGGSPNMTKWGVNTSSTRNLSNKVSSTDHRTFTNNDCGGCHNYTVTTAFTFHNASLTNGSGGGGGSNCIFCHNIGGSRNNVNFSALNMSMHATLNSGAQSTPENIPNKPCWGCHGTLNGAYANESDQPVSDHNITVYKNPRKCYDCHITGSLKFTGKNVTDHIPSGYTASTDVSVTSYCSYCHNNSANNGYEPDGMGITGGSIINASVSHYGANRSANRLMAQGSNSTDCVFCHRNNSNMIVWGIIQGSLANISNKNSSGGGTDHDPYTSSNNCSQCHGNYVVSSSFTFHNSALGSGVGSGPDCKSCHDVGGSIAGKLVNFSAMNDTNAIHRNLNNGAAASVNIENRKCWACHDEGTQPSGHNNSRYKTPYKCQDCHTETGTQNGKYPGWNVTEHVKAGTVGGTELFTPQAGNCYSCHNLSEMMVGTNLDPDGASPNIYGGENGGSSSTSHYGRKRNLGTGDAYCIYCHNNASTAFVFDEQHNKRIYEHTGNSTADVRNSTTLECIDCHTTNPQSYRIHNSTLKTPAASEWTAGGQDRCAPCHKSTGNGSNLKVNNSYHNTSTGNITDCSYCHNSDSLKSSAPQNIHSDNLTKGGNSSYNNCNNCHQNGFASKAIFEHTNSSSANITNASMTCEKSGCHNTNRTHSNQLVTPSITEWTAGKQDRCSPCHKSTGVGSKLKVNNSYHNTTTGNITDCSYCHNSESVKSSAPQNVHSRNLTKGGTATYRDCYTCHQNGFTSKAIFEHTNSSSANITAAGMTCEKSGCHNSNKTHSIQLIKPATSMWTPGGNDYCVPCHKSSDSLNNATKKVFNSGHDPAGKQNDNITSCANCHNTSTPGAVPSSFKLHDTPLTNLSGRNESTCSGCHNGTTAYVGQGKLVLSHIPDAYQYGGNTSNSGYTCKLCHNMTGKISMHSAGLDRSNGTCDTCHFNNTSPFKSLTKNITLLSGGMVNHTYDGRDRKTCNTTMCHNASGRVKFHLSGYAAGDVAEPQDSSGNPAFINRASWSGDINDRGILVDCRDCHEKYNDTAPFFAPFVEANRTGVNNQEHVGKGYKLTNCYVCHTSEDNVSKSLNLHNVSIEPLTGGPACTKCHDLASLNRTLDNKLWMNATAFNSSGSVHKNFINNTLWNGSNIFKAEDTACWVCHQSDGKQPERHTDKKDEAYKAYRCADCHTTGGIVGIYQPAVYNNSKKISKHYPGSVFLNEMVFTDSVSCSICHKNSLVADINITGYPNPLKADDINASHYGTRADLINTSLLNGCQRCHGVDGPGTMDYGNARKMPELHNYMSSTPVDCETSCHNSAVDINNISIPVDLHNNSVGVYVGSGACNSPGCHTPPPPPEEGTR